jgi:SAM-dependent methyltransferase
MEPSEYDTLARLEESHWWYVGMRRITARLLRRLDLPTPARILDAGCGVGGGLRWLSEFGVTTGIDWHPRAVQYATRASARVARASVQALPFLTGQFDLVTSFEVLYHLAVSDDVAALHEMARVLRPGGWLVVRVPAYNWLRGAHDRQVHTRQRYAARELREKIEGTGLRLQRLTSVGLGLLPLALLRRLLQTGHSAQSDVVLPAPFINRCLTTILAAEGFWLERYPWPAGLSLLALAQKERQQSPNSPVAFG